MKRGVENFIILALTVLVMLGCSFGGFDDKNTVNLNDGSSSDTDTILTGIVSKGPFQSGTIQIYAVSSGAGGETLLRQSPIGAFGNYSGRIPAIRPFNGNSYTGVVIIKASGNYVDEATGKLLSISADSPLRAILANPSGDVAANVTPLTELAVQQFYDSGNTLAAADVTSANQLISQLFRVDILGTEPVRADLSDAGFGNAATTQEQKDYTLALATISWLAKTSGSLSTTLATLNSAISSGTMSADVARSFRNALDQFLASDMNLTGVRDSTLTNLTNVGGATRMVKLSLEGKIGSDTSISGVTATLDLPPGVTVRGDFSKAEIAVLEGTVTASSAISSNSYLETRYIPASNGHPGQVVFSIATAGSFTLGELVSIRCDFPPGATPLPGDFWVSGVSVKDGNGAPLSGVGIAMPVVLE